jgi:hypothetical protein
MQKRKSREQIIKERKYKREKAESTYSLSAK